MTQFTHESAPFIFTGSGSGSGSSTSVPFPDRVTIKAVSRHNKASDDGYSVGRIAERLGQVCLEPDKETAQFDLLQSDAADEDSEELIAAPIFTAPVLEYSKTLETDTEPFSQYGLLGQVSDKRFRDARHALSAGQDPRVFFNAVAPSSVFICGSQGSGKSHTLSCLLENCLTPSVANVLPRPLTGVVFHYDPWCSDTGGSACEAAFISSAANVSVRVLCSPTNVHQIRRLYQHLPRVVVEELRINQSDLNTKRMLDLMAVSSSQGPVPLYIHVVTRILRELRIEQQVSGTAFNYRKFKDKLATEDLTVAQAGPLRQRLEALESFMVAHQVQGKPSKSSNLFSLGNDWTPKAGQLTIVDLSCPCVTVEMACSLFNICLSLFLEQKTDVGRVVALDEAHKFMTETAECRVLTEALLATIRLQRHQAMRVFISTQEPTISPKLLDLCSVTIVHRFSSPDWLQSLRKHLAGASVFSQGLDMGNDGDERERGDAGVLKMTSEELVTQLFSRIVALRRGEALMFAPSAIIGIRKPIQPKLEPDSSEEGLGTPTSGTSSSSSGAGEGHESSGPVQLVKLGHGVLNIRVRMRVTRDGGRSIMAA